MSDKVEIEELIADARAEEEVARAMSEAKVDKSIEDFKDYTRHELKKAFAPLEEDKVMIGVSEYVDLKQKELDLGRLLEVIDNFLEYDETTEGLYMSVEGAIEIKNTFKALYPEIYKGILVERGRQR